MPQPLKIEIHIKIEDNGITALDQIATESGLSKQRIKQAMQKGAVWLTKCGKNAHTQRLRRAKKSLKAGDTLHLYYDEALLTTLPTPATLIADEGDYSVWFKPFGMRSQGSKWGDHCTLYRWAEQHLKPERPAFVVHRLDRAATGVILLAHKKRTAAALAELFQKRTIDKRYRVIVHGHFLSKQQTINSEIDGRHAVTHATLLDYDAQSHRSLLEIKIESGRKHQIRRHLARMGFPVVGDRLYGREGDQEDLRLIAYRLTFVSPIDHIEYDYQLPKELMHDYLTAGTTSRY